MTTNEVHASLNNILSAIDSLLIHGPKGDRAFSVPKSVRIFLDYAKADVRRALECIEEEQE